MNDTYTEAMNEMKQIETVFYPGWCKKAITFTIDDGNFEMDRKLLDIVRPAGIYGTFNVCSNHIDEKMAEEYRTLYAGYGIANHCKYHPYAFADGVTYQIHADQFDEKTADEKYVYPMENPTLYMVHRPKGWRIITDASNYAEMIRAGKIGRAHV